MTTRQPRGGAHHKAKITWEAVADIRSHPEVNNAEMARRYGVTRSTIRLIRENVTWRDEDFTPVVNPHWGSGYKEGHRPQP